MDTYGGETEEYKEARMNWGGKENELNKQIGLSCGFEELRKNLDVFEEMKEERARGEIERQEKVGNQLPTIQEENGEEMEMDFGETEENDGGQNQNWIQKETNIPMGANNENNENVESGGGEMAAIEELEGFAGG